MMINTLIILNSSHYPYIARVYETRMNGSTEIKKKGKEGFYFLGYRTRILCSVTTTKQPCQCSTASVSNRF